MTGQINSNCSRRQTPPLLPPRFPAKQISLLILVLNIYLMYLGKNVRLSRKILFFIIGLAKYFCKTVFRMLEKAQPPRFEPKRNSKRKKMKK